MNGSCFLALAIAALASATIDIVCFCCLRTEREMKSIIVHVIREQDCPTRELERARIEKAAPVETVQPAPPPGPNRSHSRLRSPSSPHPPRPRSPIVWPFARTYCTTPSCCRPSVSSVSSDRGYQGDFWGNGLTVGYQLSTSHAISPWNSTSNWATRVSTTARSG